MNILMFVGGPLGTFPSIRSALTTVPAPTPPTDRYFVLVDLPVVTETELIVSGGQRVAIVGVGGTVPWEVSGTAASPAYFAIQVWGGAELLVSGFSLVIGDTEHSQAMPPSLTTARARGIQVVGASLTLRECIARTVSPSPAPNTAAPEHVNFLSVDGPSSVVVVQDSLFLGDFTFVLAQDEGLLEVSNCYAVGSSVFARSAYQASFRASQVAVGWTKYAAFARVCPRVPLESLGYAPMTRPPGVLPGPIEPAMELSLPSPVLFQVYRCITTNCLDGVYVGEDLDNLPVNQSHSVVVSYSVFVGDWQFNPQSTTAGLSGIRFVDQGSVVGWDSARVHVKVAYNNAIVGCKRGIWYDAAYSRSVLDCLHNTVLWTATNSGTLSSPAVQLELPAQSDHSPFIRIVHNLVQGGVGGAPAGLGGRGIALHAATHPAPGVLLWENLFSRYPPGDEIDELLSPGTSVFSLYDQPVARNRIGDAQLSSLPPATLSALVPMGPDASNGQVPLAAFFVRPTMDIRFVSRVGRPDLGALEMLRGGAR